MARFTDLPNELLLHIARCLSSWQDLAVLSATNRCLNHVAGSIIMSDLIKMNLGYTYLSWSINGRRLRGVKTALTFKVNPNERLRSGGPAWASSPTPSFLEPDTPRVLMYKRALGDLCIRLCPVYCEETIIPQAVRNSMGTMVLEFPKQLCEYRWNYENGDVSALHLAAQRGDTEIIRLLLEHGADPEALCRDDQDASIVSPNSIFSGKRRRPNGLYDKNVPTQAQYTPLHYAISFSNIAAAKLLIASGASQRTCVPIGDSRASSWLVPATPLHLASFQGLLNLVEHIVEGGYQNDINSVDEFGGRPLAYASISGHMNSTGYYLLSKGGDPNTMVSKDCNLLLDACWHGRFADALLLLDYGAKLDGSGSLFTTVLHACCSRNNNPQHADPCKLARPSSQELPQESLRLEVVKRLLGSGVEVDKCIFHPGFGDATALLLAADCGLALVVEELLSAGADPNVHNVLGFNALTSALNANCDERPRFDIISCLLDHGCDVNKPDHWGNSPLHLVASVRSNAQAVSGGWYEEALSRKLLEGGADIHARTTSNVSVFQSFCKLGSYQTCKWLAEHGALASVKTEELLDMFRGLILSCTFAPDNSDMIPLIELLLTADHTRTLLNYPEYLSFTLAHSDIQTVRRLFLKRCTIPSACTRDENALHKACLIGAIEAVEILLDRGKDVNQPFNHRQEIKLNGRTLIESAIKYATCGHQFTPIEKAKTVKLFEFLLSHGASVQDTEFSIPLIECFIKCNQARLLDLVFKHSYAATASTFVYSCFLDMACDSSKRRCRPDVIRVLLQHRLNLADRSGVGLVSQIRLPCGKKLLDKLIGSYRALCTCPCEYDCDCGDNLMKCLVIVLSEGRLSSGHTYTAEAFEILESHRGLLKNAFRNATLQMGLCFADVSPNGTGHNTRHCLAFMMDKLGFTSADLRTVSTRASFLNTVVR